MDETGNTPSDQGKQKVAGRRGTKTQHKQGGADRENVTAIVTFCADGSALRPTLIFKGKNFMRKWNDNNVSHALISHSPNGWTDSELAYEWMTKDFDPQTRGKANGHTHLLLLDGHSSHYTPKLLRYAKQNNIIILGYPPHCTHTLQGLDVVCFARLKEIYKREVNAFEILHKQNLGKGDFTGVWGKAFVQAFTIETIVAAFRATGISPFNPAVITAEQMKPSKATSTRGAFPVAQPSPVRAVMAAFHARPATAFDVDPDTHMRAGPSHEKQNNIPQSPETPTRRGERRALDPNIDPALYTPSKRICLMTSAIAGTSSGSFLMSEKRFTSAHKIHAPVTERPPPLPNPNWTLLRECDAETYQTRPQLQNRIEQLETALHHADKHIRARDTIIEAANATLVIQNIKQKKEDRAKLYPNGMGRYLTEETFITDLEKTDEDKTEKATAKVQRAANREAKKVEKREIEAVWKTMKTAHERALKDWEAECERLTKQGVPKKNHPAKPKCPTKLKPKTARNNDERSDSSSGSESNG